MSRFPGNPRHRGLTMVEVLIALGILGVSVLAITTSVTAAHMQALEARSEHRIQALADALLDEILAKPYVDPDGDVLVGPDAGETSRLAFDAIDDYHGYKAVPGQIIDCKGELYPEDYQNYTVEVALAPTTCTILASPGAITVTGVEITISITDRQNRQHTVSRFEPEPIP